MAQLLLGIGGTLFLVLGTLHGVLTLRDVAKPRAFTPTDDAVRIAWQGARLAMTLALHLRIRGFAIGVLVALSGAACATGGAIGQVPDSAQPFVPDVTEEEWQAALPAKESGVAQPRLIRGRQRPDDRGILGFGETARATAATVIRADGTVGLYRIVASTNPRFTQRVIEVLRSQVYEPPLLNGRPVAVSGEMSFQISRTP